MNSAITPQNSSPYFTPSADVTGSTIFLPYDITVKPGDALVYSSGGGAAIGGLVDGGTYYATNVNVAGHTLQLALTKCQAVGVTSECPTGSVTPITLNAGAAGSGRSHSLVLSGQTPSGNAGQVSGILTVSSGTATYRGLAVSASNADDIFGVGISGGVSAGASVAIGGSVNIVTATTRASIGVSAKINVPNTGANSQQSVIVAAGNQFHLRMVSGAVAVGLYAGVAPSASVGIVTLTTDAYIDNLAQVNAANDVRISATATDGVVSVALAGGGGIAGIAGAVSVILLTTHSYADTRSGDIIHAGNNMLVAASDASEITVVAGGIAGGVVGIGAGVAVTSLGKDTEAYISPGSTIDALATGVGLLSGIDSGTISGNGFPTGTFHGLAVQANSSETVFGLALGVGGGLVGVAGGINVTLIHATTLAFIDSSTLSRTMVNQGAGASNVQSVRVAAADATKTLTIAGAIAAGFVGAAGGVDVGVANTSTKAYINQGASVSATRDLSLFALSIKDVASYAASIAGGAVGVAGALSIWTVGTQASTSYNDGPDGNTNSLSRNGDPQSVADSNATGSGGYTKIVDGLQGDSSKHSRAQDQIRSVGNSASGSVAGNAPGAGLISGGVTNPGAPEGTVATISTDVAVVVGGNVDVRASENFRFVGLAGSGSGGVVGVGLSLVLANLTSHTDASIQARSSISAGGNVSVSAGTNENSSALSFGGVIGLDETPAL